MIALGLVTLVHTVGAQQPDTGKRPRSAKVIPIQKQPRAVPELPMPPATEQKTDSAAGILLPPPTAAELPPPQAVDSSRAVWPWLLFGFPFWWAFTHGEHTDSLTPKPPEPPYYPPDTPPVSPTPEPGTLILVGTGVTAIFALGRKRRRGSHGGSGERGSEICSHDAIQR